MKLRFYSHILTFSAPNWYY